MEPAVRAARSIFSGRVTGVRTFLPSAAGDRFLPHPRRRPVGRAEADLQQCPVVGAACCPHRTFGRPWFCCAAALRSRHSPQTHGLDIAGSQECGTYCSHSPQALDQCRTCEAIRRTERRGPDGGTAWQPLNQSVAAARCPRRKGSIRLSARSEELFIAAGAP